MSSRLRMTVRNALWSYVSLGAGFVLRFVSRTVFLQCLDSGYLGINGLFSNVLGVLSFAELGIGTAMNFSLYAPAARDDREKLKSLLHCYKWAYRAVAAVILVLGLALVPFLHLLVQDPGGLGDIRVYYLIFLGNTLVSYFVSYKFSLVHAQQKGYLLTNLNTLTSAATTLLQVAALLMGRDYLCWLLIGACAELGKNLLITRYLNRLYPWLRDRNVQPLTGQERQSLIGKVRALILHKLGEVSVHQTDNIIISCFVSLQAVGLISNYNLLMSTVSGGIGVLFSAVTGSLGNLIATESKQKQYDIFRICRFLSFWLYGFSAIALYVLATPFVKLWLGPQMVVEDAVIGLILLNFYLMGQRICLNNMKTAAGLVERDQYVPLCQAAVNLVSSVVLVRWVGLPGVYLGTVLQGLVSTLVKPVLVYRELFGRSSRDYFRDGAVFALAVGAALLPCLGLRALILTEVTPVRFLLTAAGTALIPNGLFLLLFGRREELRWILDRIRGGI